ncbi:hypothetical protein RclHR1_19100001 [Rhizophagus clarus]|uniref:Zinc finger and SCAN domain-containing protein 29-like n=1 Tax=Rhizophagus clarus TaxID=94130 RepID=A0A2Z6QNY2_9GLOM|nr:hypothetical protein RclHR1_19100001 [Rhizophagus clarus]GES85565.1 zinc finger and SCAN domain-containing protein 29-like [Rhizophagus clarus]
MTKPRTLKPKLLAPKPLAPLVTNPVPTLSQNQISSGFEIGYRTDTLTPNFQYLENESNEINKELGYSLRESRETDNSFCEKTIPVDILNMNTQSFSEKDSTDIKENDKMHDGKKRKNVESQVAERWSDEETDILLSYLDNNYEKLQQGKKATMYNLISTEVIKTKSSECIKRRIKRLLETYEKVKRQNDKTGSKRIDWKWYEKLDRIYGCRENINPSFISNDSTVYISDGDELEKEISKVERFTKKKKNSIESLIDVMNNISQTKLRISEQKLQLDRKKK